jgi:Transposase
LLEPVAWKAGTAGSEGAPARRRAGATRLAHLVLPARRQGPECAVGQRPRCQERAGTAQDKLDAVWLCKVAESQMLRPSFVPPAPIRRLRDYTRLREDLTRERSRYWQQLEKLLEDAAIKVSAAADSTRSQGRDVVVAGSAGFVDKPFAPQLARS